MSAYVSLLLATDRLAFRPLTRDDIPSLCARVTEACVADMCAGGHDVRIPSEMEKVFARAYLILRHGQIVGTFNFNDDNQSFGIWIAPEHRGCGYASEAVEAFASHPIFGAASQRSRTLNTLTFPIGPASPGRKRSPNYPAQQESCFTSLVKVCAQSLMPSTMVRYGNSCPPRSVTLIPARSASAAVWIISPASAARI